MFERTYILALPNNHHRIRELRLLFPDAVVVDAFHGRDLAAPEWFKAGFGAWGCYMSHLHVLMSAIHDKLHSYLVLEEDALFVPEYHEHIQTLEEKVPSNWGQLYLGGSHQAAPEMLDPYVYACHSVDRTHAFAVSAATFKPMLTHLMETELFMWQKRARHIDQVLQKAHEKCLWPVYAPTWWFAGQRGGLSSISLDMQADRWWHCPAYARALPFIVFHKAPTTEELRWCHFGNNANELHVDWRLNDSIMNPSKLLPFLNVLAQEALIFGKLPALRTNKLTVADLFSLGQMAYQSSDNVKELANYPRNNLINNGYYPKRTSSAA